MTSCRVGKEGGTAVGGRPPVGAGWCRLPASNPPKLVLTNTPNPLLLLNRFFGGKSTLELWQYGRWEGGWSSKWREGVGRSVYSKH